MADTIKQQFYSHNGEWVEVPVPPAQVGAGVIVGQPAGSTYVDGQTPPSSSSTDSTRYGDGSAAVAAGTAVGAAASTGMEGVAVGAGSGGSGGWATAVGHGAATAGNYAGAYGYGTSASGRGAVAIGTDSAGGGAVATASDEFVLGTANHDVKILGTLTVAGVPITALASRVAELERIVAELRGGGTDG